MGSMFRSGEKEKNGSLQLQDKPYRLSDYPSELSCLAFRTSEALLLDIPIFRSPFTLSMDEFQGPISEIINHGLAGTLPFNPNYHFVNSRAYPCPHVDDWNDEPESHICTYPSPPQQVWFLAHFDRGHMLQPLRFLDISWPLQNLYRATNSKMGHLVTLEQVRMALDGLTEA
ncbi:hypothetical protein LguiB_008793 [Lonicera macranthoides]